MSHSSKYRRAHRKWAESDVLLLLAGALFALVALGLFLANVWVAAYIIKGGKP